MKLKLIETAMFLIAYSMNLCAIAVAADPQLELPPGIAEIYRFRGDLFRGFPDDIFLSRNGGLATILDREPIGSGSTQEFVLMYSKGLGIREVDLQGDDNRILTLGIGNSGAVIHGAPNGSGERHVYSVPFEGDALILHTGSPSSVSINDDGVIVFSNKAPGSSFENELWLKRPEEAKSLLPPNGDRVPRDTVIVDNRGAVTQVFSSAEGTDIYQWRDDLQWKNLTASWRLNGGGSPRIPVEASWLPQPNAEYDFLFQSRTTTLNVNYFRATDDTIATIFSTRTNDVRDRLAEAIIADNGDVLFNIDRIGTINPEYYLLRVGGTEPLRLDSLLPKDEILVTFPNMNSNGDIALVTQNAVTHNYNGKLLRAGSTIVEEFAFKELDVVRVGDLTISDELIPYFWLQATSDQWVLGTVVPEPTAFGCLLTFLLFIAPWRFRNMASDLLPKELRQC